APLTPALKSSSAASLLGKAIDAGTRSDTFEVPAASWQTATSRCHLFGRTDLKVHRCELTGLKPGGEYVFQLGQHWGLYRFRTMPAKANDLFTFVSGGDCGIGPPAIASNHTAARQDPAFVLIAGDLGYDNGVSAATAITFIKNYSSQMVDSQGRLIPLITTIGNHEVRGGYKGQRSDATYYLPLFDGLYRDTTYNVLDFGDYLSLVLLDTGHVSPIDGEQTDWLEKVLKQRQECPHLVVAYHVPAYPSVRTPQGLGSRLGTGELQRRYWCPLLERYGVDAVLEHHDHVFKRTHPLKDGLRDRYGLAYLGDGSWGKLRVPASPEQRPYLARVSRTYHLTVHRLEGEQRFHVALTESGKVADVYTTTGKRPARRG
ncbi:MAG: metallophosphoesterase, partial [Gemmataceae bacterium]|nr:metallophosphoesterase [Gemmataceae bacterium]